MNYLNLDKNNNLVVVCGESEKSFFDNLFEDKTIITPNQLTELQENFNDAVLIQLPEKEITDSLLQILFKAIKPEAQVAICKVTDLANIDFLLKTNGFINIQIKNECQEVTVLSTKPKFDIGSSVKLTLKQPATVWTLEDDAEETETIDPDELLDESDLKKPDPSSLRVCGTTGKRKACKDCSCGLAEELSMESKTEIVTKSSCGSCYLGDAFRCASCPYLGMPAFKPGEKIQISDNLLKADL